MNFGSCPVLAGSVCAFGHQFCDNFLSVSYSGIKVCAGFVNGAVMTLSLSMAAVDGHALTASPASLLVLG